MRVAFVIHKFPPTAIGGTEFYTYHLSRHFAREHEIFVFYRYDGTGDEPSRVWEEGEEGYRALRVGRAFDAVRANPAALFFDTFANRDVEAAFTQFLYETRPDIVHFQHLMLLSHRLISIARDFGIPTVLTFHDYWFVCSNAQLIWPDGCVCRGKALGINCTRCATVRIGSSFVRSIRPIFAPIFQLRDAIVKRAALQAQYFLSPSAFLRQEYVSRGFPAENFDVLENGVDVDRIRAYPRVPGGKALRVTYLGSLAWQKGVHVLVEAARSFTSEALSLKVYGNPDSFPSYSRRLKEMANPMTTTFCGTVPNIEVGRVLAETDLLAVPSVWYENSPVVIQESRAAGVPVIASRIGALPEKVGEGGILVPPNNVPRWHSTLQQMVKDRGLLGRLAGCLLPPITLEEHASRLFEVYSKLVGGNR